MVLEMYVILIYDIQMDKQGTGVLRRTFKTCKKYLAYVRLSVFEGELTPSKHMIQKRRIGKNYPQGEEFHHFVLEQERSLASQGILGEGG